MKSNLFIKQDQNVIIQEKQLREIESFCFKI